MANRNEMARHPHAIYAEGLRDLSNGEPFKESGISAVLKDCADLIDALAASCGQTLSTDLPMRVRMAGAEAITEDHMVKRANYDAACDCWDAMTRALSEGK